jgi:hypothetical protein
MSKHKLYKAFEAKHVNGKWTVVTKEDGIIVAVVPEHLKPQKVVAIAIASSLSEGRFAFADLV